ncbi:uncharacterized protein J3R85_008383 [Psidium guajava]|nr:uncharacterized protein J3R85_008383 [Psidium guajava]
MRSSASIGSKRSNYSRRFDLPEDFDDDDDAACRRSADYGGVGGAMLPVFLNDLRQNSQQDLVEVTLELEDDAIVVRSVTPTSNHDWQPAGGRADPTAAAALERNLSITTRIRSKFPWLRSGSSRAGSEAEGPAAAAGREARRARARLERSRSSAQRALKGLRFISRANFGAKDNEELWRKVEARFHRLATDGLLAREDFGECIGTFTKPIVSRLSSTEISIILLWERRSFMAAAAGGKVTKDELHDFWLQISDQSFDARLQIFFDMADSNEDGRITREEVQELLMLSASANKLSQLKEQAEEYASLIMEELDPENLGYIELWQLETLLLQKDTYMNYSRPLSTPSVGWSQNLSSFRPTDTVQRISSSFRCLMLENWQRGWILLLWAIVMGCLFTWKFIQYRNKKAFHVMGYCLATAKGAAETLKLNMALILPVCRNTLTWLRSTRARPFVPFDDNINFHKIIACAIVMGIVLHAGDHLACDFPRLVNSSPEKFALISSDFNNRKPTYKDLLSGVEGVTGIAMVIMMALSFTLATHRFRRNLVRLPAPFNRLTGFNAFWYSHHLLGLVYVSLLIHGTFLYLVHDWYRKTTWMYISIPLLLYMAERSVRACRSNHYAVRILTVSVLPGNVFSITMSKPQGFKYRSGQYIFLQCPTISPFEWHPFSITSAPGDDYLSVSHQDTNHVAREASSLQGITTASQPKLLVDGPYGGRSSSSDVQNYDVLLLVGPWHLVQTPSLSILRDLLLSNTRAEAQTVQIQPRSRVDQMIAQIVSHLSNGIRSFEWFKGVMDEVAEMDHKGQIELHNYLTSVYEEGDARSTLITMVQASQSCQTWFRYPIRHTGKNTLWKTKLESKYLSKSLQASYTTVGVLLREDRVSKGIEEAIARAEPQDIYAFRIPQGAFLSRPADLEASRCNPFFL